MDIYELYRLLEIDEKTSKVIEETRSLKELKQAYRDIAFVWHPDRITGNPRVQKKAEEKLKKINEAYEQLQTRFSHTVPSLRRIEIYPIQVELAFGESKTFWVTGFDQNGNEVELDDLHWSVSGGGTMFAEGTFFAGYEAGSYTVIVTSARISATIEISIYEPVAQIEGNSDTESSVNSQSSDEAARREIEQLLEEFDDGFPWKRLLFWGFALFVVYIQAQASPDISLNQGISSLSIGSSYGISQT